MKQGHTLGFIIKVKFPLKDQFFLKHFANVCLSLQGLGLKIASEDSLGGELVITDFNMLSGLISKLLTAPSQKSCDLGCLGDKVSYWTIQDLLDCVPVDSGNVKVSLQS